LGLAELCLFVAERRTRAVTARELANHLLDQEERQEILRTPTVSIETPPSLKYK
jgi:hypothetical protein